MIVRESRQMRVFCLLWIYTLGFYGTVCAAAGTPSLRDALDIYLLRDHAATLTIDSVLTQEVQNAFQKQEDYQPYFGFGNPPFWYKLVYSSPVAQEIVLDAGHPGMREILLYVVQNDSIHDHLKRGRKYYDQVSMPAIRGNPIYLNVIPGENYFYIRAHTGGSMIMPISVSSPKEFEEKKNFEGLIIGLFYGLIIAMLSYNLMLYLSLGDITYLYYVIAMICSGMVSFVTVGYSFYFLWPDHPGIDDHAYIFFGGLSIMASSRFTAHFLQLPQRNKRMDKLFWLISLLSFIMAVLSLFYTSTELRHYGRFLTLIAIPSYLIIGTIAYRKGYKPALFFLLAWIPFVIGLVIKVLSGAGLIPFHPLVDFGPEAGTAIESVLLSLALADRINVMKKEIAQKDLEKLMLKNTIMEEQKVVLEQTVQERTEELKASNSAKDKLFAIVSHDLRGAITSFKGIGQIINYYLDKSEKDKVKEITHGIDKNADQLNNLLDNVLHWSVMQMGETTLKKKDIAIEKLVEGMSDLYSMSAKSKDITLHSNVSPGLKVYADENAMNVIFRNFISNAIKFTKDQGNIYIEAFQNEDGVVLLFRDTGVGMDKDKATTLFSTENQESATGTLGERGLGLGLKLSQYFIEQHQGTVRVESEIGVGTTFEIQFPST